MLLLDRSSDINMLLNNNLLQKRSHMNENIEQPLKQFVILDDSGDPGVEGSSTS